MGEYELFPPLPGIIKVEFTRPYWDILSILGIYLKGGLDNRLYSLMKNQVQETQIIKKNIKKILFLDSGTSALYAILKHINAADSKNSKHHESRNEIIIPSYVCKAVIRAVLKSGATPVFADIDDDFNISPESIKKNITKKTLAVIAVHQYGKACKIDEISRICKNKGIILIEDSAIPIGLKYKGKFVGTYGDYSLFSFNMGKTIVSFGGGALISNASSASSVRPIPDQISGHSKAGFSKYMFFMTNIYYKKIFNIPYNILRKIGVVRREENIIKLYEKSGKKEIIIECRGMSRLQKAATIYQLENLNMITKNQREIAEIYYAHLKGNKNIILPGKEYTQHTQFPIIVKDTGGRYKLSKFLSDNGIETQWTFYPLHLQEMYERYSSYKRKGLKNTEEMWKKELSLPIGPSMKKKEAVYVCEKIREYYSNGKKV